MDKRNKIKLNEMNIEKENLNEPLKTAFCIDDFIPIIEAMKEKERLHLHWLVDNNAPKEMIETSRNYLNHFRQRHKEYQDYVADYC